MVSARLYVEGGGNAKRLRTDCRRGFAKFMEKAGLAGAMPKVIPCESRNDAYDSFKTAMIDGNGSALLLVDAEIPVTLPGPWQHLKASDNWDRPANATDAQCHLMVQIMESWFLADLDALASFYGTGFRRQALPRNPDIESVTKQEVLNGLAQAARGTKKRDYNKGRDSFEILGKLDPDKIRQSSGWGNRFIRGLS